MLVDVSVTGPRCASWFKTYFAGENGPPTPPPRPRPRMPAGRKPFCAGAERWSCMKKAPRLGMKAGSASRFFLYSSCSLRRRSPSVSCRPGPPTAGAVSAAVEPVSKSTTAASLASSIWRPLSMISVSLRAVKVASERAMGGDGCRRVVTSECGFASCTPFAFRFTLPSVRDGALSTSLRSLLSASPCSSTSLRADTSLCESSASSVATDLFSSSSSSRLRRAMLFVLLRTEAMIVFGVCGGAAIGSVGLLLDRLHGGEGDDLAAEKGAKGSGVRCGEGTERRLRGSQRWWVMRARRGDSWDGL